MGDRAANDLTLSQVTKTGAYEMEKRLKKFWKR